MILGYVLLLVSLMSMAVYLISLFRLVAQPYRRGLVRTAVCRVAAAGMYTVIAMATLSSNPKTGMISVGVFVVIQLMWQANSVADVLLTRRENRNAGGGG
jgi:hypothetical protein